MNLSFSHWLTLKYAWYNVIHKNAPSQKVYFDDFSQYFSVDFHDFLFKISKISWFWILLFFFLLFRAKNMKKKFQFLRRRNTDTAIGGDCHSSPVFRRPSPEQVQKWSRSFDCLLNDKGQYLILQEKQHFWICLKNGHFFK